MLSELLVATRSKDKLREIQDVLESLAHVRLLTLDDVGIAASSAEDDIEAYATFTENAVAKARYFARLSGMHVLADDSGLCVDALDGAPGVRTKRFALDNHTVAAGTTGKSLDEANNDLLLERISPIPVHQRGAYYVCAAAFAADDALIASTIASCRGMITTQRAGDSGFGYDPLFFVPDDGVTFAQLTRAQKNARSHRARAFRALAAQLK